MNLRRWALVVAATSVLTLGMSMKSCSHFVANLSGDQEVPPAESLSHGEAIFFYSELSPELPPVPEGVPGKGPLAGRELRQIDYKLIVGKIEEMTQAHIHCGPEGENGDVTVFLFGFIADGVTMNGIQAEGTITEDDVRPVSDSAVCPGGIADLDDLLEKMESGYAYVNVHTVANPAGEIRGQIRQAGH